MYKIITKTPSLYVHSRDIFYINDIKFPNISFVERQIIMNSSITTVFPKEPLKYIAVDGSLPNTNLTDFIGKGFKICNFFGVNDNEGQSGYFTIYCIILAIAWLLLLCLICFDYFRQIITKIQTIIRNLHQEQTPGIELRDFESSIQGIKEIWIPDKLSESSGKTNGHGNILKDVTLVTKFPA